MQRRHNHCSRSTAGGLHFSSLCCNDVISILKINMYVGIQIYDSVISTPVLLDRCCKLF